MPKPSAILLSAKNQKIVLMPLRQARSSVLWAGSRAIAREVFGDGSQPAGPAPQTARRARSVPPTGRD
ncbi:hypothetical protein VXQ18_07230 [Brucella abortus]|nr:hypothetical protein [Brucella abortus]